MAKTKISEFNSNPALNTDIDSINIAEGCSPSGINDAIRELMAQLKDWQSGTSNDPYVVGSSGSLTLNQGTANGVAYLNGSKVVTSGSALTFDGTNLGVGTASPSQKLHVAGNIRTANCLIEDSSTNVNFGTITAGALAFLSNGGTEGMRLTSTGLGIGTSSPSYKLDVTGTINSGASSATGYNLVFRTSGITTGRASTALTNTSGDLYTGIEGSTAGQTLTGSAAYSAYIGTFTSNPFYLVSAGAIRATLDSSGNLGLGVTPSAWYSTLKAEQVGAQGSIAYDSANGNFLVGKNFYKSGASTYTYTASDYATMLVQGSGSFQWYTAPSGTAGNAITFTQALTLDASGNLRLGLTGSVITSTERMSIQSASGSIGLAINASGSGSYGIGIYGSQASGATSQTMILFQNSSSTTVGSITANGTTTSYVTSSDYRLKNITGPITASGAYIDSLNPVEGTWKSDGSTFVGLIAHEVQEASRTQVATGTKDGAEMQGMDYSASELIANLIAEVKSLRQRVATLEAK